MHRVRFVSLLLVFAGLALAGPDLDPRSLTYRVRASTIELDGTTQRLSGDVALVVSATRYAARLEVKAQRGQRGPQRVLLEGEVEATLALPAGAFPGVEGAGLLRCRQLEFDPQAQVVVFREASYSARAGGEYAGTYTASGIQEGRLELGGDQGPKLALRGPDLEIRVLPVSGSNR